MSAFTIFEPKVSMMDKAGEKINNTYQGAKQSACETKDTVSKEMKKPGGEIMDDGKSKVTDAGEGVKSTVHDAGDAMKKATKEASIPIILYINTDL